MMLRVLNRYSPPMLRNAYDTIPNSTAAVACVRSDFLRLARKNIFFRMVIYKNADIPIMSAHTSAIAKNTTSDPGTSSILNTISTIDSRYVETSEKMKNYTQ